MRINGELLYSAIGWGRLSETANRGSSTLQQVLLQVEEGPACDRIKSGRDLVSQFCAGDSNPSTPGDTCQGDRCVVSKMLLQTTIVE